jgi:hypothetical protein
VAGHEIGNPVGLYYSHRRGWLLPPDREPALWKRPAMLPDDQRLIAVLAALRQRGVTWLAIARSARDAGGARLLADRPRFIQHLERTWTRIAESESYVIYRAHDDADVHN